MAANASIAIVGMGCRFSAGASSPDKLWDMLAAGESGWSEIPKSRMDVHGIYHPESQKIGSTPVRGGHFLEQDIAAFDAPFFGIPTQTAIALDPQLRIQLEVVYEALEDAGIPIEAVKGSDTSVYAGILFRDYHDTLCRDPEETPRHFIANNAATMYSNRVSHFFDLRGASMTIDTACSTTLTATHLACQNLRTKESRMCIVTGSNIMINPDIFIAMSNLGFLSPDGMSYAFDDRANGYGRGDGVAAIVLKTLEDAIRDGDSIRAIIRDTALNQDGQTQTITTPNAEAQKSMILSCYERAGLDVSDTSYVEAHGTGTPTGDPLELSAISAAFPIKDSRTVLHIGSVKSNVGHTEATSGLASIIKTTLALEKGLIPPNGNFKRLNPKLLPLLKSSNMAVPTSLLEWKPRNGVRRASINNFGFGGANAHAIVDSYPPPKHQINGHNGTNGVDGTDSIDGSHTSHNKVEVDRSRLYVVSAKTEQACQETATNLAHYLSKKTPDDAHDLLADLAYTLGSRRSRLPWVAALKATNLDGLVEQLQSPTLKSARASESPLRVGLVFTGQGAQWFAMGRELILAYPLFRDTIRECDEYIRELGATWTITEELFKDAKDTNVNNVQYGPPMSTAVQIALVRLLWDWGVKPVAITSHSSGEIAAAYAAGVLPLRSAIGIPFVRSCLASAPKSKSSIPGGMIAVGLGREAANQYIQKLTKGELVVACINSQSSVTLSGDLPAVEEIEELVVADGVFARRLKVTEAFHSHHMLPMSGLFEAALMKVLQLESTSTDIIFSSPSTGGRVDDFDVLAKPDHWVKSMLNPVEFESAFCDMCFDKAPEGSVSKQLVDIVLEVGPHGALGGPIKQMMELPVFADAHITYLTCLSRGTDAVSSMHSLAMGLIKKGYGLKLDAINFPCGRDHVKVMHDLPPYPWSHKNRYWFEPRLNRALRLQPNARHDLIGSRSASENSFLPVWRNHIRVANLPWVRDHIVQSNMLYPAAGYICMAIEGMRQLQQTKDANNLSYDLRDVQFVRGLVVPDDENGIEVQLRISDIDEKDLASKGWSVFRVFSVSKENIWSEHCHGFIRTTAQSAVNCAQEQVHVFRKQLNQNELWDTLKRVGIEYGPTFKNITKAQQGKIGCRCELGIADIASVMPHRVQPAHVLHPTTLDSIIQVAYCALPEGGTKLNSAFVPRSIASLHVSSQIPAGENESLVAEACINHESAQDFSSDVTVQHGHGDTNTRVVIDMKDLTFQSLGPRGPQGVGEAEPLMCISWNWKPDVTLMNFDQYRPAKVPRLSDAERTMAIKLRKLCLLHINDAVSNLAKSDRTRFDTVQTKYYTWMQQQLRKAAANELAPDSAQWVHATTCEREQVAEEMSAASINGEVVSRLGPHVATIMRKGVSSLDLALQDELLSKYLTKAFDCDRAIENASELVSLCVHKWPRAKILEIGAGTGRCTQAIMDRLTERGLTVGRYDYTDISADFFDDAKKSFAAWKDLMTFGKFNVECSADEQGYQSGSYDIVVACQVLHATADMETAMANTRRLLKPGGKLILIETTNDTVDREFVFGLLSGECLSRDHLVSTNRTEYRLGLLPGEEPERGTTPSLSIANLREVLGRNGFNGLDVEIRDCDSDEFYQASTVLATADECIPMSESAPAQLVVVSGSDNVSKEWTTQLREAMIQDHGQMIEFQTLSNAATDGKFCIYIDDSDQPSLMHPGLATFSRLQNMLLKSLGVLWVSRGATMECHNPASSMHLGFLRTIAAENGGKIFASLDLDPKRSALTELDLSTMLKIVNRTMLSPSPVDGDDVEYSERNGIVHVPRAVPQMDVHNFIVHKSLGATATYEDRCFSDETRPTKLYVGTKGLLDSIGFTDDADASEKLPDDYVEIEARAIGLNFRDVMVALGALQSEKMGFECSGIITRLGPTAVAQGLTVGSRVAALLPGSGWCSRPRTPWTNVVAIPREFSWEEAASFPLTYSTAYIALCRIARLQSKERVLIHSGTGGVGQAAVAIAQLLGAEVFVTTGSNAKAELIMQKFGISRDHIFSSRDESFADRILLATDGKGVDVALNSLSGKMLQKTLDCMCQFGRFVEIGKKDLEQSSRLNMHAFTKNLSFTSFDVNIWQEHKGQEISGVLKEISKLFDQDQLPLPSPITTFPISSVEKAFRHMQSGKHTGKTVITIEPREIVPVVVSAPTMKLLPMATYLVVGGLGGLGSSLCDLLVERGAKHIIVISRSGRESPFLQDLQTRCNVKNVACDITDLKQLQNLLQQCSDMPPIRGVVQGAMVLKDVIVDRMTRDDFLTATQPKVQGTLNLHHCLGNLDFFVMLSSLVGVVGGPTQANYAAGNSFQDAFAAYRVSKGQPAVTIDLGVVKGVGYAAEKQDVVDRLADYGFLPMDEQDVLRAFEIAVVKPNVGSFVTGIATGPGPQWHKVTWLRQKRFATIQYQEKTLSDSTDGFDGATASTENLGNQIAAASSFQDAQQAILRAISAKLVSMFGVDEAEIDPAKSAADIGVDSLVAVELRNWLSAQAACELSVFEVIQSPSLSALSEISTKKSRKLNKAYL